MPIAFAPPLPPNPFRFPPATHPAKHPVTLLPNDQPRARFRNGSPSNPHVPAPLSPPVSADRFLGFGWSSEGGWTRCSGVWKALPQSVLVNSPRRLWRPSAGSSALGLLARKALTHSVLVKRVAKVLVHCAPAFDQRIGVQCWPGNGSVKRVLGLASAVAWKNRLARQIVLVRSFSSACNAPLPTFCDPGAGSDLHGWGASHA